MQTYHKIECPFERDINGSRQIVWDKWVNPTVEYLKDNPWVFTEKVDGTNTRIVYDGYRVQVLPRKENSEMPPFLREKLTEMFLTDEVEEIFEQQFGSKEVILFGEGYGNKIQGIGSKYRKDNSFILFDVMINGNYQPRKTVEDIARMLGIDVVPIIMTGTIYDAIKFVIQHPKSTISHEDLYMEGLVGRPAVELQDRCGNRIIVKIKWKDFRQFVETQSSTNSEN